MAELTPLTQDLIQRASALADEMGHRFVGSEHLLLAMVEAGDDVAAHRILAETNSVSAIDGYLAEMFGRSDR